MKKLEAIIKPMDVEQVREALGRIGVRGITTTDVRGFGRDKEQREVYRGTEFTVSSIPEVKMEIILQDGQLEDATAILQRATAAEHLDGDILIFPVETANEYAAGAKTV